MFCLFLILFVEETYTFYLLVNLSSGKIRIPIL